MTEEMRNIEERQENVAQKLTKNCPRRGDECARCSDCASTTLAQVLTVDYVHEAIPPSSNMIEKPAAFTLRRWKQF